MKKYLLLTFAILGMSFTANAMSYEQARQQALFLTDKMAYELNLTEEQYEAAYEVNFDYLLGVNDPDEIYGTYWERRNIDLSYILLDWQYSAYLAASYFYRPLYWSAGFWHFGIYARYPHRDYFYFGRPGFFDTYRGGHCWHHNGGRSWYNGRSFVHNRGGKRNDKEHHSGMRDSFRRGDFGNGQRHFGNNSSDNRQQNGAGANRNGRGTNGSMGNRGGGNSSDRGSASFGSRRSSTRSTVGSSSRPRMSQGGSARNTAPRESSMGRRTGVMGSPSAGKSHSSMSSPSTKHRARGGAPSASTRQSRAGSSASKSHSTRGGSPSAGSHSSSRGGSSSAGGHHGGGGSHGGRR